MTSTSCIHTMCQVVVLAFGASEPSHGSAAAMTAGGGAGWEGFASRTFSGEWAHGGTHAGARASYEKRAARGVLGALRVSRGSRLQGYSQRALGLRPALLSHGDPRRVVT